jgi:hypothetical protein
MPASSRNANSACLGQWQILSSLNRFGDHDHADDADDEMENLAMAFILVLRIIHGLRSLTRLIGHDPAGEIRPASEGKMLRAF